MINSLQKLCQRRNIDILLTTHNAALLNQYDKEKLLGVSVVYRDKVKGTSKFIPFVDIENYQDILITGGLGNAMINDTLVSKIKEEHKKEDYSWLGV